MEEFLNKSREAVANLGAYETVVVVLGNQTCDLDSAVCAIVHGLFQYHQAKKNKRTNVAVIPVLNISEKEFRVKTEVVYYLKRHNVPSNLLTFRDHTDLEALSRANKLELTLVDHHALPDSDSALRDSVVEIIDHRPQDLAWTWPGKRVNLRTVGSCATLVARNILADAPELLDTRLSNLLRGPILIDTCNFSRKAERATPEDHAVMQKLDEIAGCSDADRNATFHEILRAKTDISGLRAADLLIRDLKVASGVPIAGLPILVKDFMELNGALDAVKSFTRDRGWPAAVIMGMELKNDRVTRDIAVFSSGSNELENKITQALATSEEPALELTVVKRVSEDGCKLALYEQGNVRATRKQILPIIQSAAAAANKPAAPDRFGEK